MVLVRLVAPNDWEHVANTAWDAALAVLETRSPIAKSHPVRRIQPHCIPKLLYLLEHVWRNEHLVFIPLRREVFLSDTRFAGPAELVHIFELMSGDWPIESREQRKETRSISSSVVIGASTSGARHDLHWGFINYFSSHRAPSKKFSQGPVLVGRCAFRGHIHAIAEEQPSTAPQRVSQSHFRLRLECRQSRWFVLRHRK
jgi:hypothetical protein